ncbi:biopolymer transporter ExbD [Jiella mangrovi]|uniref:Biopolymer transporter ExbD n=1 Tax=Jiella mangrovi TaxID=2821407 RepID=A0ABS4BJ07_9HYPH|nr:biopolymer transporter ExbD [Jiella mangrovi]MBP0616737.1 biopolymer transporter ExbD [Jiella mangrovi]
MMSRRAKAAGGGLSLSRKRRRPRSDPAIPTINVVFLLLLFFILAGTVTAPQEAAIDPARTGDGPGGRLPRPLLTITTDAALGLDGQSISRDGLGAAVAELARQSDGKRPVIHVLAARDLPADTLVWALGEISAAGAATSLVVLKADRPGERTRP